MPDFRLVAAFQPTGDQPQAIERLSEGLANGLRHQVLLGATGTGKTFTIATIRPSCSVSPKTAIRGRPNTSPEQSRATWPWDQGWIAQNRPT